MTTFPTTSCGMQNGSPFGICTHCIHVFFWHIWHPIVSAVGCLITKFPHRSSVGSLLRVRCRLGCQVQLPLPHSSSLVRGQGGRAEALPAVRRGLQAAANQDTGRNMEFHDSCVFFLRLFWGGKSHYYESKSSNACDFPDEIALNFFCRCRQMVAC